jgi:hypothetical protein
VKSASRVVSAFLMAVAFVLVAVAFISIRTAAHANDSMRVRFISHSTAATFLLAQSGARPVPPVFRAARRRG